MFDFRNLNLLILEIIIILFGQSDSKEEKTTIH